MYGLTNPIPPALAIPSPSTNMKHQQCVTCIRKIRNRSILEERQLGASIIIFFITPFNLLRSEVMLSLPTPIEQGPQMASSKSRTPRNSLMTKFLNIKSVSRIPNIQALAKKKRKVDNFKQGTENMSTV